MIHSFDTQIAEKYGVEKAVLLYNIELWVAESKAGNKYFYDDCYWAECSYEGFLRLFPYLKSKTRVIKLLSEMRDECLIVQEQRHGKYIFTLGGMVCK